MTAWFLLGWMIGSLVNLTISGLWFLFLCEKDARALETKDDDTLG